MCKLQAPFSKIVSSRKYYKSSIYSIGKMTKMGLRMRAFLSQTRHLSPWRGSSSPQRTQGPCLVVIPHSPQQRFCFASTNPRLDSSLLQLRLGEAFSSPRGEAVLLEQFLLFVIFAFFFACFTFKTYKNHMDEGLV